MQMNGRMRTLFTFSPNLFHELFVETELFSRVGAGLGHPSHGVGHASGRSWCPLAAVNFEFLVCASHRRMTLPLALVRNGVCLEDQGAGNSAGARAGRPRCMRIPAIAVGSSIAARTLACGARTLWKRMWCRRGRGTGAARRWLNSCAENRIRSGAL